MATIVKVNKVNVMIELKSKRTIETKHTKNRNVHNGTVSLLVILKIFDKHSMENMETGKIYRK